MKKLLSFLMMGNWAIGSLNAYAEHWNLFAINSLTAGDALGWVS